MSARLVILGLSLSSSWGNGHATTWRSLIRALANEGAEVLFLERDVPWYASNRDLTDPDYCRLETYTSLGDLFARFSGDIGEADAVIVGSYVPDGIELIDRLAAMTLPNLAFYDIDTPLTLARLSRGDEDYLVARQIPLFSTYFSFSGGPSLTRLESEFGAPSAVALYCSADPLPLAANDSPARWDLGYLGTYSADRQPLLERLMLDVARALPHLRFVVAGPGYPESIVWPDNLERIVHVPPAGHAGFYRAQRFTLNLTRADMAEAGYSPSVRLFEAAAAGTPVISDMWEGLDTLFAPGEAILTARRAEDVVAILSHLTEPRRRAIAEAARARVLAAHTGAHRARTLLDALGLAAPIRARA